MKYAEAGRLKHILKMHIPHVLAIDSLVFMFVNFVNLFTITSIKIYEELMLVYFQLMSFS